MNLHAVVKHYTCLVKNLESFSGIGSLLLRLYLAPVMIQAGWTKWSAFDNTVSWFGNDEWGLGLPFPSLMVTLVILAEFAGGILLLLGLFTRLVTLPLIITMVVAVISVHGENGWPVIADSSSWFADGTLFYNESVMEAPKKLEAARSILKEHGNYKWLTSSGRIVVLNNGIEFAVTYFVMLVALLFMGAGSYFSMDYWLTRYSGGRSSGRSD